MFPAFRVDDLSSTTRSDYKQGTLIALNICLLDNTVYKSCCILCSSYSLTTNSNKQNKTFLFPPSYVTELLSNILMWLCLLPFNTIPSSVWPHNQSSIPLPRAIPSQSMTPRSQLTLMRRGLTSVPTQSYSTQGPHNSNHALDLCCSGDVHGICLKVFLYTFRV